MKLDFEKLSQNADALLKNSSPTAPCGLADDILAIINEGAPADFEDGADGQGQGDRAAPPPLSDAAARRILSASVAKIRKRHRSLADFPKVVPEKDDPNILIKGRWLERGGAAFLVSTAGTGKSIWMTQFAVAMIHAVPFSGLAAWRPLKCWIAQTEDSDSRVAIDRDDIVAGLEAEFGAAYPDIDWRKSCAQVDFVDFTGYTGASFLEQLRVELEATDPSDRPDVIIINPFMDFLGGDVVKNADCIAFLAGGDLGGRHTEGLRSILREFAVAALLAHHTGKPPTDAEIASWIMSSMPEYKACGASYITNWGRSFITMMKIPGHEGRVMLTAGKNGGGLGWPLIAGARRIFLSWADEDSCGGSGRRHYWRRVTDDERRVLAEAVENLAKGRAGRARSGIGARADEGRESIAPFDRRACARFWSGQDRILGRGSHELREIIFDGIRPEGRTFADAKEAVAELFARPGDYGLAVLTNKFGKKWLDRIDDGNDGEED